MNNPRDTHFQGFAKALWAEIEAKIAETGYIPESAKFRAAFLPPIETLIAQRAYDFAEHVATEWEFYQPQEGIVCNVWDKVSDMPELPEV